MVGYGNRDYFAMDLNKKFYVTDMFYQSLTAGAWGVAERKTMMYVMQQMSVYTVFKDQLQNENGEVTSLKDVFNMLNQKDIPRCYEMYRDDFVELMQIRHDNAAREIRKMTTSLGKRGAFFPNTECPDDPKSFIYINFFESIRYNNQTGLINFKLTSDAIPYLAYLNAYTVFRYECFYKIKNKYALHFYIYIKNIKNKYKKSGQINKTFDEFKTLLGLPKSSYNRKRLLEDYVLNPIKNEINNFTDLNMNFNYIKEGKKYTRILFDYCESDHSDTDIEQPIDSPQYQIMVDQMASYGINPNQAEKLLFKFGQSMCDKACQKLKSELDKGREIKNKAGYLSKCVESAKDEFLAETIQDLETQEKQKQKQQQAQISEFWDKLEQTIENNFELFSILLERFKTGINIITENEIPFYEELQSYLQVNGILEIPARLSGLDYYDIYGERYNLTTTNLNFLLSCFEKIDYDNEIDIVKALKEKLEKLKQQHEIVESDDQKFNLEKGISTIKEMIFNRI